VGAGFLLRCVQTNRAHTGEGVCRVARTQAETLLKTLTEFVREILGLRQGFDKGICYVGAIWKRLVGAGWDVEQI
jgi:hypothetical protein